MENQNLTKSWLLFLLLSIAISINFIEFMKFYEGCKCCANFTACKTHVVHLVQWNAHSYFIGSYTNKAFWFAVSENLCHAFILYQKVKRRHASHFITVVELYINLERGRNNLLELEIFYWNELFSYPLRW